MRQGWLRKLGLSTVFGSALGCATSKGPNLLTPVPEQYNLPPEEDARFTQPVSYPKDVLNQDPIKQASGKLPSQQGPMGGGPGAGGGGSTGGRGMTPGGF
jgi:hypothetical protein